jgi:uncharacterized membrane protein YcaP (DUF421 family)
MKKEDIHLSDIHRILFGGAPAIFLIEVLIRTLIIYVALLVLLRFLGKRMDGQITIIEMAVMVTLGAIVSVGMQMPDRGILASVVALICVFIFHRGINWLAVKSEKVERVTQGTMSILVKDGIMQLDEMKTAGITHQNIFTMLRGKKIFNLGKVKRVYLESCGMFNIYEKQGDVTGLPILPENEPDVIKMQGKIDDEYVACQNCGKVEIASKVIMPCMNCGAKHWTKSIR